MGVWDMFINFSKSIPSSTLLSVSAIRDAHKMYISQRFFNFGEFFSFRHLDSAVLTPARIFLSVDADKAGNF